MKLDMLTSQEITREHSISTKHMCDISDLLRSPLNPPLI